MNSSILLRMSPRGMTPADAKSIRESLRLSDGWIAHALDVDTRTVRRWEDGSISLRPDLVVILKALEWMLWDDVTAIEDNIWSGFEDVLTPGMAEADWPVLEVPRIDADVTWTPRINWPAVVDAMRAACDRPIEYPDQIRMPAAYYRAVAAMVREGLEGRLRLRYNSEGAPGG